MDASLGSEASCFARSPPSLRQGSATGVADGSGAGCGCDCAAGFACGLALGLPASFSFRGGSCPFLLLGLAFGLGLGGETRGLFGLPASFSFRGGSCPFLLLDPAPGLGLGGETRGLFGLPASFSFRGGSCPLLLLDPAPGLGLGGGTRSPFLLGIAPEASQSGPCRAEPRADSRGDGPRERAQRCKPIPFHQPAALLFLLTLRLGQGRPGDTLLRLRRSRVGENPTCLRSDPTRRLFPLGHARCLPIVKGPSPLVRVCIAPTHTPGARKSQNRP